MQGRAFVCGGEPLAALVRRTEVFLLDMDGTVYVGDQPIGAMAETLASIRASGRRIVYCTNNSSRSAQSYAQKLRALGLFDARDAVFTSGMAAIALLKERFAGARVYLVGTEALKTEFSAAGIPLAVSDADADVAVLGYDTTLTYEKLVCINRMLVCGKPYIATHADNVCPAAGVFPPDAGSFIRLLQCSSGREPDVICGKPHTVMGQCLTRLLGVPAERVAMVGDRPYTDIRFGNNNGFRTLLVLSGETKAEQVPLLPASDRPSAVADSLNDAVPFL